MITRYYLINKDKTQKVYYNYADLLNSFFKEYGCYPLSSKKREIQEGFDNLYFYIESNIKQDNETEKTTETKISGTQKTSTQGKTRKSKYQVFNEKWEALFADKQWILKNRQEFVMDYLVLLTSRKQNVDRCSGYSVTKNKKGYSIKWHKKNIGLSNLDASTAYSWTVRKGLRVLAVEADQIRVNLF